MTSIADGTVQIQTSPESVASTPSWFGEVALMAAHLRKQGVLSKISERVRFARRRFGHYEVIDFLAVLFGYAMSGERTLEAFYQRLQPFAGPFMALFERDQLPARSTLSRFLAALTPEPVEALRTLFLDDLETCPRPFAGWMRSVPLATRGASEAKWCGRAPSSVRLTASSGSARLATAATVATERNCARASLPSVAISRHTSSHSSAPCCGSMDNMAPGPCSPTWVVSPL